MDQIDRLLLAELQRDSSQSQRSLAERVGLSQNAVWRRLKAIEEAGLIERWSVRLNRAAAGLGLTVFTMVRTRRHSAEWLRQFRGRVTAIPGVIGFYRISGDYDYLLKIVAPDIAGFDRVYQQLIDGMELETVTSYFAMESILDERPLPL